MNINKYKKEKIFVFIILYFLSLSFVFSQERKIKIPLLSSSPKIDGILDENLWENEALKIKDFFQFQPKEKSEPSEKTIAYVGHDKENLYLAIRCFDSNPDRIKVSVTNRDTPLKDDTVYIYLDTFNEKRRAFVFGFNPIGVQIDGIFFDEGGSQSTKTDWDAVFFSNGQINEQGYIVEAAIPFKSLRFPAKEEIIWGMIIERNIPRKGELITWPSRSRDISGVLVQSAQINIGGKIERGRNIEIIPAFTSLKRDKEGIDPQAGVNFKYGLTSDLVIDATLNPDFSHIEADAPQIDINQRYALYWNEKRPFFLEGKEIFDTPINIIYTRRIIDPILGGKITGKIGKLSFGFITSLDQNPTESLWEISGPTESVEKSAFFNIFRAKYDLFNESYVGFSLTDKEINDGSYNRVFGIDGQFKWRKNFYFNYQAAGSETKFPDRTTDIVSAFYGSFRYSSRNLGFGLGFESIHPDFEASSGFIGRTDYKKINSLASYTIYPGKKYLSRIIPSIEYSKYFDFNNNAIEENFTIRLRFMATLNSRINFIFTPSSMESYANIDFKKKRFGICSGYYLIKWAEFGLSLWTGDSIRYDPANPYLGWSNTISPWINFKPLSQLQLRFDFNKNTFWKKRGGKLVYDYNILRQKTTYQITKEISVRTILDYNHYYKKIYGSFLLSYILRPGAVVFLGFDDNFQRDEFRDYVRTNRSVFIKFSYWWRI
ncbi:MAG: carbohydrate binding family 9 domain-containing protein [Candidatus Aminicenantes bacterium]|nr:carbohydrate binding family 9 domain-containing protein [Candidatus Aminicenantes bacterium]